MHAPMDENRFWRLVEGARPKFLYTQKKHLTALAIALGKLDPDQIVAFDERRRELLRRSFTWNLWAAAYVIGGGCGDDEFDYFRSWVISRGRAFFDRVIANPDSLAHESKLKEWFDDLPEFESFDYIAAETYEQKTASTMPEPSEPAHHGAEPSGDAWDEEDEDAFRRLVPELLAKRGV